jgi:2-(1,2-epoxy-1,2-dihydrophenyl)acetyl-CoA isomerase
MSDSAVTLTIQDGRARLLLNRSDAGNAIDRALVSALLDHAKALEERDDVRVVTLAAAGKAFCVGGDLKHFASAGDDVARAVRSLADPLHEALELLSGIDAPVVAAVNGVAAGAGMSLVCAADLVIAAESARFTMAYTAAGLSPDCGATWFLPRIIGVRRAAELMLLNDRLDARAAAALGIVTRVVSDEDLESEVEALAASLATGPTRAYGAVKRLLRASATATLEDQLAEESATIAELAAAPDGREGVAAFLAKRAPVFEGR